MEQVVMSNKISVITVVFNDAKHIRDTMESFFSQTWENKEYIVIDGGSTDGTADIIKEYQNRLTYWCSEKDGGIYDAMNKGIIQCNGDWINILNSGDTYVSAHALEDVIKQTKNIAETDVIYGDSIEQTPSHDVHMKASCDPSLMQWQPIYRHGSSLIRSEMQKKNLFDLSLLNKLDFSLDWEMIFRIYNNGARFQYVNVTIQNYQKSGISNQIKKSLWYNYIITSQGKFKFKKALFYVKQRLSLAFTSSFIYEWIKGFFVEYCVNDILPHIPFWIWRKMYLQLLQMQIGQKTFIMKSNYIISPNRISIGDYTHVNRGCLIDARGHITIGNNVSISHNVSLITGSHLTDSTTFKASYKNIRIDDYAWLGIGCTILQGVHIGEGAVVCAGAIVTKSVEPYTIVAGIPARRIGIRNNNLEYHCIWDSPFT
uniref:Glycosyltransferase 2-like domain-containing protein n=1 Tax=Prevotella sp. GTC17254 TaxID=3236794 RepID=A0AB33IS44_9BACT